MKPTTHQLSIVLVGTITIYTKLMKGEKIKNVRQHSMYANDKLQKYLCV